VEIQHPAATITANDPSGLDDRKLHIAFIGARGRRKTGKSN
jgi:hypothetical protein